jgi:hypothetical protein
MGAEDARDHPTFMPLTPPLVALYLALCLLAGLLGRKRRIGFWGFFFSSILFTPLIGLLYIYFATPRRE